MSDRVTDETVGIRASVWGRSRRHAIATVLSGGVLGILAYYSLRIVGQPFPALFPGNAAGILVYGVVVATVALAYDADRGLLPTYALAYLPIAAANYYGLRFHVGGVVDTPGGFVVYGSILPATVYWVGGLLSWLVVARYRNAD